VSHAELGMLPLVLPELTDMRQQQLDWCMSRITRLDLSYDCLAKRVSTFEDGLRVVVMTCLHSRPLGDFEIQLYGLSSDMLSVWSEYWELIIQSAVQSICDSIESDSVAIVGTALASDSKSPQTHRFLLTNTPADRPIGLSLSCKPSLAFKPTLKADASSPIVKVKPLLEVGCTAVPLDRFEQMRLGGLLVLRRSVANGALLQTRISLAAGIALYSVSWNLDEGIILVTNTQQPLDDSNEGYANSLSSSGISVPIFAQIELSSVDLDHLKGLKEEDTLQTGVFAKDAIVKLSAGGVLFGEGQLVQIDGRLAVRITKMNRRGA
jgi:Type III flagellar switch regulator (C-ring) FliN C-term